MGAGVMTQFPHQPQEVSFAGGKWRLCVEAPFQNPKRGAVYCPQPL